MAGENSLVFQIGADLADLQRKLSEAKGHLKSFADEGAAPVEASLQQISRSFEQLGSKLTSIGTTLSVAITAPLVGVGVAAVNVAGEFGAAMNKVKANLDDVTVNGMKQLDLLAQQLGAKTKFSALEAAQGMGEFAAAGFKTQEIMAVMPATLDLAAAAQTNVAEASRVTKDLLGQFGLSAKDAQNAIDVMAKAGTESSGSLLDMANSLTYVGPVAKSLGMNIVDTTAALIELDKAGLRNEKSGRALRDMLGDLVAPTTKAQEVMTSLGISVKDAAGNLLPFPQVMENFKIGLDKTHGSAERLSALTTIFGKESLAAAEILTSQGSPALLAYAEKLSNVEGAASKMAKTMNEGTKGALEQLRGSLETAGIALGQALEPALVSLAKTLQNFIDNTVVPAINWFKQLPEPVQIGALALTAMAAAAGPLLIIAGQLASSIGALTALFVPAATGATAATTAFTALGGSATILATGLGAVAAVIAGVQLGGIVSSFGEFRDVMDSAFPAAQKAAQELEKQSIWGKEAQQPIKGLAEAWREFTASLPSFTDLMGPLGAFNGLLKSVTDTVKKLTGTFPEMAGTVEAAAKRQQDAVMATARAHLAEEAELQKKRKATEDLNTALAKTGQAVSSNQPKLTAYAAAVSDTAKAKREAEKAATDYNAKMTLLGLGNELAGKKALDLKAALDLVRREVELGVRPQSDLAIATDTYRAAIERLYPTIYTLTGAYEEMRRAVSGVKQSVADMAASTPATTEVLGELNRAKIEATDREMQLNAEISKTIGIMASDYPTAIRGSIQVHSEFSRSIGEAFGNLFGGLSTRQKEQIEEQRKNLDEHAADYQKLAETIQKELDGVDAKWESSAAKQIATQEKALGKTTEDFEKYASGIQKQLEGLENKYVAAAEKQVAGINDKLDDAAREYEKYAAKVGKSLDEITEEHRKKLQEQVSDLRSSLADRTRDLEQYRQDTARKLGDIDEDWALKTREQVQREKDALERRTLDMDQYRATVQLKLQQIAGDNSASAQKQREDLLLSLQQRQQDYDLYRVQTERQIALITEKNANDAAQQRDDANAKLREKEADYAAYQTNIESKIGLLTAKHAEEAEKERQALLLKLEEKKADYDAYRAEMAAKIDELRATAVAKAEEERAALLLKLDEKKADFDAYKAEMAAKVEEIKQAAITKAQEEKDALKTKLDEKTADFEQYKKDVNQRIDDIKKNNDSRTGEMGSAWGKFTKDAGDAVGVMTESILDKLFRKPDSVAKQNTEVVPGMAGKWEEFGTAASGAVGNAAKSMIADLFDGDLSWKEKGLRALTTLAGEFAQWGINIAAEATGIAGKLAGIFSSIKVPSINIPGLGGGSTGGASTGGGDIGGAVAGAVSSGISGAVGMITGAVSAISGVIGNFQFAGMNKSLDVIVQHTLQTKNELTNLRADEWTREGHNMAKWDDIWNAILGINAWDAPVIQKLDSIWGTLLGGGITTGGGGGTVEAALQSIEASSTATNDHLAVFRTEVSTGFANAMTKADGLWGTLQSIEANTAPVTAVDDSESLANVELGLRNINITGQGSADLLAAISTNIGAMRNNIGNIIGIKEAIVGQLGMIFSQIADHVVTALGAIDNKLQPVYDYYRRITNSSSAIASSSAATNAVATATQSLASLATAVSTTTQTASTSITSASNTVASSAASSAVASNAATTATTANTAAVQTLTQTVAVANAHTEETEAERRDREQREREEQDRIRRERDADDRARRAREEADRIARERDADQRARQAREAADAAARARDALSRSTQSASLSWLSTGSLQSLLSAARGGWLTQGTMASLGISGGFNRPGNNIEVNINGGVVDRDLIDEIGNILVARLRLAGQS